MTPSAYEAFCLALMGLFAFAISYFRSYPRIRVTLVFGFLAAAACLALAAVGAVDL